MKHSLHVAYFLIAFALCPAQAQQDKSSSYKIDMLKPFFGTYRGNQECATEATLDHNALTFKETCDSTTQARDKEEHKSVFLLKNLQLSTSKKIQSIKTYEGYDWPYPLDRTVGLSEPNASDFLFLKNPKDGESALVIFFPGLRFTYAYHLMGPSQLAKGLSPNFNRRNNRFEDTNSFLEKVKSAWYSLTK